MAGGCSDGIIRLWDMRRKELSQSLRTHSGPVTSVVWSSKDTFLCSGSTSGEIVLHSQTSGVEVARLRKDSQGIKVIQYSALQDHILAACNEAGSILVWDTTRRAVDAFFPNAHNSPSTGLAFSPVNNLLLCSSGLDQRLLFYDIREKKVIKTLDSDAPLTCLAFNADGFTVAAGTLYGDIKVYDLRAAVQSKAVLRGHNGDAVNAIEFGKMKKSTGRPGRGSESAKTPTEERTTPDLTRLRDPTDPHPRTDFSEPLRGFRTVEEIKLDAKNRTKAKERFLLKSEDPTPSTIPLTAFPEPSATPTPVLEAEKPPIDPKPPLRRTVTSNEGDRTPTIQDKSPISTGDKTPVPIDRPVTPFNIVDRPSPPTPVLSSDPTGFTLKQMDMLKGVLESVMNTVRHDMKNENANLHVEIIRQMCIQQVNCR